MRSALTLSFSKIHQYKLEATKLKSRGRVDPRLYNHKVDATTVPFIQVGASSVLTPDKKVWVILIIGDLNARASPSQL